MEKRWDWSSFEHRRMNLIIMFTMLICLHVFGGGAANAVVVVDVVLTAFVMAIF